MTLILCANVSYGPFSEWPQREAGELFNKKWGF